jgi:hypothetical protein
MVEVTRILLIFELFPALREEDVSDEAISQTMMEIASAKNKNASQ